MELERTVGEKGQVVIPKDVRERLGLRPGSEVVFDIKGEVVVMKPKKTPREIVEEFCSIPTKKFKRLTPKKLEKILDEEYEIP